MANSLRSKIKKLYHDNNISEKMCNELLEKLEGHDRELRNKVIDEFYDEILNFEDYIEPVDTSDFGAVLLYSGIDITNMIVKIKEQLKGGGEDE